MAQTSTVKMPPAPQPIQSRFLIVGHGDPLKGDDAVGPKIATTVANWHVPATKAISTPALTPALVNYLVETDYVIFVEACSHSSCVRTMQIDPIVISSQSPQSSEQASQGWNPLTLLNLTQQRYGQAPQAWRLQIPTEHCHVSAELSSTAQRGYDRALRTIEQFFTTYRRPQWMSAA